MGRFHQVLVNVRLVFFLQNTAIPNPCKISFFNSYRRSNGSNLASLIKKELDRKDLRVFVDVDNLEEGPFPDNLLEHIKNSRSFVLILTESALDRCINDLYVEDWVHKEVRT